MTEPNDLVSRLRAEYVEQSARCGEEDSQERALLAQEAANEIERLREVVAFPIITPATTSSALFIRVLAEHEKGQPVNAQDLINALMWRVNNQRREIARLHEPPRKAYSSIKGAPEYDAP